MTLLDIVYRSSVDYRRLVDDWHVVVDWCVLVDGLVLDVALPVRNLVPDDGLGGRGVAMAVLVLCARG